MFLDVLKKSKTFLFTISPVRVVDNILVKMRKISSSVLLLLKRNAVKCVKHYPWDFSFPMEFLFLLFSVVIKIPLYYKLKYLCATCFLLGLFILLPAQPILLLLPF